MKKENSSEVKEILKCAVELERYFINYIDKVIPKNKWSWLMQKSIWIEWSIGNAFAKGIISQSKYDQIRSVTTNLTSSIEFHYHQEDSTYNYMLVNSAASVIRELTKLYKTMT